MTKREKVADRWRSALRVEGMVHSAMETVNEEFMLGAVNKSGYEVLARNLRDALTVAQELSERMRQEYMNMMVPYGR